MTQFDATDHSHRRFNPLLDQWVLCSPHRAKRPWQGSVEAPTPSLPKHDPKCYLCPGNTRVNNDIQNPNYNGVYVFTNDFPALRLEQPNSPATSEEDYLFQLQGAKGTSQVICYSDDHSVTMASMDAVGIEKIVAEWKAIYQHWNNQPQEGNTGRIKYIQIFENKGAAMGCSNPHPHGQVWCMDSVPTEPNQELMSLKKYGERFSGQCMLCSYARQESAKHDRIVVENDEFVCVVPWWGVWPFETLILSKRHLPNLLHFDHHLIAKLSEILHLLTVKYDNLFECSFPYSMGIHQSPLPNSCKPDELEQIELSHFHMHFYPPLLRSSSVKKWLVGFELLAEPQRDLTPEQAAKRLRDLPTVHYTKK